MSTLSSSPCHATLPGATAKKVDRQAILKLFAKQFRFLRNLRRLEPSNSILLSSFKILHLPSHHSNEQSKVKLVMPPRLHSLETPMVVTGWSHRWLSTQVVTSWNHQWLSTQVVASWSQLKLSPVSTKGCQLKLSPVCRRWMSPVSQHRLSPVSTTGCQLKLSPICRRWVSTMLVIKVMKM